jgi:hypothetical protein
MQTEIPHGYCQCGCGRKTTLATHNDKATGAVKGVPRRFIKNHDKTRPLADKYWEKVDKQGPDDCWNWTGAKTRLGYGSIGVDGKTMSAHRVAWAMEYGSLPDDKDVCHHCDNPGCVNPKHLFLGTETDNMRDKMSKGRGNQQKGERNGNAKLTSEAVTHIRELAQQGRRLVDIAAIFGISDITVGAIVKRRAWKHVP